MHFGEVLFSKIREEFNKRNHISYPVNIRFAELGKDYGIIGAAELIRKIEV